MFSEHASVSLFECLIVAGAPATGLFQMTFKDGNALQMTLQLLRDMWKRADALYIPSADLDCLHRMECNSVSCEDTRIPDRIASEMRKLSRYYIYLLFRYCLSSAGPTTYNRGQGFVSNCFIRTPQHTAALQDVPGNWLETKVSSNYPSAPPLPDCNFVSGGMTSLLQQQQPQSHTHHGIQSPSDFPPKRHDQTASHQDLTHRNTQRTRHRALTHQHTQTASDQDVTHAVTQRLLLQYPDLSPLQSSGPPQTKVFKGSDRKTRTKNTLSAGCYNSDVESDEEY